MNAFRIRTPVALELCLDPIDRRTVPVRSLTAVEGSRAKLRRHVEAGDARLVELLEDAKLARDLWERETDSAGDG